MRKLNFFFLSILLWSCANPIPPNGGPIDSTPPRLIIEESTPNKQINAFPKEITFTFNEWIKLENFKKQMIISPPLEFSPMVIHKGKRLTLEFDEQEVLKPNTTYAFQFGQSIVDLTEGNAAQDLKFVFSTGPYIDSLKLNGTVIDAITDKPVSGVIVMLYRNNEDSIPYLEKPIFISRTDSIGNFEISNLPKEEFKIFALEDKNVDYLFNGKDERIAFLKNQIEIGDSALPSVVLQLFEESPRPKITAKKSWQNKISLQFNRYIEREEIVFEIDPQNVMEFFNDSMNIWMNASWDSLQFMTMVDGLPSDTTTIKLPISQKKDTSDIRILRGSIIPHIVSNKDSLNIIFNKPIVKLDSDKIILEDSTGAIESRCEISKSNPRDITCRANWKENEEYLITLPPECVVAINGKANKDTIRLKFKTLGATTTANVHMHVEGGMLGGKYITKLSLGEKVIHQEWITADTTTRTFSYLGVRAGEYSITIIEDLNNNGRWDSGKYLDGKQPERIFERKLEALRENWDLDVTVNLNNATTIR